MVQRWAENKRVVGTFCELRLQLIYRVGQTYKNPPLSPVRLRGLLSVQLVLHWLLVDVFQTVGGAKKVKWKKLKKREGVFLYKKFLERKGKEERTNNFALEGKILRAALSVMVDEAARIG